MPDREANLPTEVPVLIAGGDPVGQGDTRNKAPDARSALCFEIQRARGFAMTIRRLLPGWFAAAVVAAASAPSPALADVAKAECLDASTKAQDFRRDGKLSEAREQLRKCVDPACAGAIHDDCTKWLDELERAQPTILFEAKDAAGRDVPEARVTMDGQPLADRLTGSAIPVDPGSHTFRFEVAGQPPVETTLLIRETEKNRLERIVMATSPTQPEPPAPPTPTPLPPATQEQPQAAPAPAPSPEHVAETRSPRRIPMKTVGLVVGGAGVAALLAGSVFGIEALSTKGSHCSSDGLCDPGSAGTAEGQATASTIGFVAGTLLVAGGAVLYLLPPVRRPGAAAAGVAVSPLVGAASGGLQMTGRW
jgi:hypothetical protein